ncbi:MAG TPA: hypothetical protein VHC63_18825 [Acidimicrobiales bacterium]|nr:hypothetical protein [Acidimicrobiales bacterium]
MTPPISLIADLNMEDDDGHCWTLLRDAVDPSQVTVGAVLIAGMPRFWSVVRITAVDDDGQVHFVQLDRNDPAAVELLATVA